MPIETNKTYTLPHSHAEAAPIDAGLRAYMLRVYNYMASGLALTGLVAAGVASSPTAIHTIFGTGLFWVVAFAPIGLVFFLSARVHAMKASTAQALFWVYAGLMGLSMAAIFLQFTGASVARVFFITAGTFAGMSLYGYTTRKDLSGFGSFLFMGLVGLIIASLVNLFLASSLLQFIISAAGVLVFTGLTAYDTQKIKEMYLDADGGEVATKKAVMGALQLYLDFINLFIMLMNLLGDRR
jgi:FtsH-binding integral membrane protein